jgi:hypothetical protein
MGIYAGLRLKFTGDFKHTHPGWISKKYTPPVATGLTSKFPNLRKV